MKLTQIKETFDKFAKYVIQQARSNLTKQNKKVSGDLYESLDYQIEETDTSLRLVIDMLQYGEFIDKGVSGVKVKYNTPYSYKDKMPPPKKLDKWVVRKGLEGIRDEKGRFIKRKSLTYLIAKSIYTKGIKPSLFFTTPYEQGFNKFFNEIGNNLVTDIENNIK